MSEQNPNAQKILCVGFDPQGLFTKEIGALPIQKIEYNADALLDLSDTEPLIVLCGTPTADLPAAEAAQLLRSKFQNVTIFLIVTADQKYNRKDVIKNGFTDLFFIPVDALTAREAVGIAIQNARKQGRMYRSVKLVDIQPDTELEFDTFVYLPMNGKHIRYSKSGAKMDAKKLENLKAHKTSSIFVDQAEIKKFYSYTAKVLKSLGNNTTMGQTEKNERLKNSVREVVTGLFSDTVVGTDSGKKVVQDCQEIVKSYVVDSKVGNIYERLLVQRAEAGDAYSHYTNVSTYAAMFAIGVGLSNVEEIALAGLVHDLGLAKVPFEIQQKKESEMTPEELAEYQKHVEYSIQIMQDRKLVLPDIVFKIVWQHHERFNGKGYPKQLPAIRLCPEAQVLIFADLFDEMTAPAKEGQRQITPLEAAAHFRTLLAKPEECPIDPAMLKKLLQLFPQDEASTAA